MQNHFIIKCHNNHIMKKFHNNINFYIRHLRYTPHNSDLLEEYGKCCYDCGRDNLTVNFHCSECNYDLCSNCAHNRLHNLIFSFSDSCINFLS